MKKLFFLFFMLWLSGCASVVSTVKPPSERWVLSGKVGIQSPEASGSASVYWQQQGDIYHIRLFGPLGMGAVLINGAPHEVILIAQDGKVQKADSAEQLLNHAFGWQLPISNLRYWVRGEAFPGVPAEKSYNAQHELAVLHQQGWEIHYLSYQHQQPILMQLTHEKIKVRMVIDTFLYS